MGFILLNTEIFIIYNLHSYYTVIVVDSYYSQLSSHGNFLIYEDKKYPKNYLYAKKTRKLAWHFLIFHNNYIFCYNYDFWDIKNLAFPVTMFVVERSGKIKKRKNHIKPGNNRKNSFPRSKDKIKTHNICIYNM